MTKRGREKPFLAVAWRIATALALLAMAPAAPGAEIPARTEASFRLAKAPNRYDDAWQFAFAFRRPERCAWPHWRMEYAFGVIHTDSETRPFASVGPVLCWTSEDPDFFFEAGVSPTLVAGSRIEDRDLGGNFHFTSSAALGRRFGRREAWAVAVRFQHLSNAGTQRPNPGLNLLGLNFSRRFGER